MYAFKIVLVLIFSSYLYGEEVILLIEKNGKKLNYYKNGLIFNKKKNILSNLNPINKDDNVTIIMTREVSFGDMQFFIAYAQSAGGQNYKYYIVDTFGRIQEFYFSRIIQDHNYKQYIPTVKCNLKIKKVKGSGNNDNSSPLPKKQ